MKINFIALIVVFFLISCDHGKRDKEMLFGNSFKYWNVVKKNRLYDKDKSVVFPFYVYKLSSNHELKLYQTSKGKLVEYDYGDLVIEDQWSIVNDSIFSFSGNEYKIKKLTADTIYLVNAADTVLLSARSL
jgi:hypothetical protein